MLISATTCKDEARDCEEVEEEDEEDDQEEEEAEDEEDVPENANRQTGELSVDSLGIVRWSSFLYMYALAIHILIRAAI